MLHLWKGKIKIERRRIPEYFTERYTSAYEIYRRWRLFGLPYRDGWAEHPAYLIRILETFEAVRQMYEQHRSEVSGNSGRAKRSSKGSAKKRA